MPTEEKKKDRQRIIDSFEERLLRMISDNRFQVKIFNPWKQGYRDFDDFKYINELTGIEY